MLKTTEIDLELLTDIEKYNFIVRDIRGGIVQCSKRYSLANNKYVSDYDPTQESNYLIYLDVNNLYGYAMSQCLPHKNFEWMTNFENFNLNAINDDSEIGYILEVDLEYPPSLHDYHNDLPFCAENKKNAHMKCSKLLTDLNDKTHYVIHYRNLQQCIRHGVVLRKIHKILKFNQSDWLKKYIDLLARSLIAKPNFHSSLKISDEMIIIEMNKVRVEYNKPIYIGFTVLELSKWKM
ncbi:uncharacterized protein ACN427_008796 [Glossina fuscipes fuscipes]